MESVKNKQKKDSGASPVERLSLRKEEQEKLEAWVQELNLKFEGMIRLTKSDLANFLIRHHSPKLNEEEINLIETEHFDEVRWLNWAVNKIRDAKRKGLALTLEELIDQRKTQVLASKKTRKKAAPSNANKNDPLTSPTALNTQESPAAGAESQS